MALLGILHKASETLLPMLSHVLDVYKKLGEDARTTEMVKGNGDQQVECDFEENGMQVENWDIMGSVHPVSEV